MIVFGDALRALKPSLKPCRGGQGRWMGKWGRGTGLASGSITTASVMMVSLFVSLFGVNPWMNEFRHETIFFERKRWCYPSLLGSCIFSLGLFVNKTAMDIFAYFFFERIFLLVF